MRAAALAVAVAVAPAMGEPAAAGIACSPDSKPMIAEPCARCGEQPIRRKRYGLVPGTLDRNCCNRNGSWYGTCGSDKAVQEGRAKHTFVAGHLACNSRPMSSANGSNEVWDSGIQAELDFWDDWMANKGGDKFRKDYERRLDPHAPLTPSIERVLLKARAANQTYFRMLDVGSGPLEGSGFVFQSEPKLRLEVTATDALGAAYQRLLDKHNLHPPVRVQPLLGEQLTQRFGLNYFDLVMCVNALDHTRDPIAVLRQMLQVEGESPDCIKASAPSSCSKRPPDLFFFFLLFFFLFLFCTF
jgi:hypothetical protein